MSLNLILVVILLLSSMCALVMWIKIKRLERSPWNKSIYFQHRTEVSSIRRVIRKSYRYLCRIPLLKFKVRSVRLRLSGLYGYNELLLREQTAKVIWGVLGTIAAVIIVFCMFDQDWISILMLLIILSVAESLYIDLVIDKAERKLLHQSIGMLSYVRHAYHRHRMIELSIEEALQRAAPLIRPHGERLLHCIVDTEDESALAAYDEAAPHRYFRLFARLSRMVSEYGDPVDEHRSVFLQGISMLIREMHTEQLLRHKLNMHMSGLKVIAVIPVLFASPIEQWARTCFPSMNEFYTSKWGWFVKVIVIAIVLACHRLLGELQYHKATTVRTPYKVFSAKRIPQARWVTSFVLSWIGHIPSRTLQANVRSLQESNIGISIVAWYKRRLLTSVICLAVSSIICIGIHVSIDYEFWNKDRRWTALLPTTTALSGWQPPVSSVNGESKLTDEDRQRIKQFKHLVKDAKPSSFTNSGQQQALQEQIAVQYPQWSQQAVNRLSERLVEMTTELIRNGFKWWEVLLVIAASGMGYYFPSVQLVLKKRIRTMDIRIELSQFYSLTMLLRSFERMTAEQLIDWMARSSSSCRGALLHCQIMWESGAEEALNTLRRDIPYPEFVRFVDQLEAAYEHVPLKEAFDDVEQNWLFDQEWRRQQEEQSVEVKAVWGQWLGFAPMYAITFLYLVLPLVWISARQMNQSFTQIQHL